DPGHEGVDDVPLVLRAAAVVRPRLRDSRGELGGAADGGLFEHLADQGVRGLTRIEGARPDAAERDAGSDDPVTVELDGDGGTGGGGVADGALELEECALAPDPLGRG